ncbi:hypothetical protein FB45DRAFT_73661 [Roridomyces roridus]|uniref:F-box domain-containing protein n=1 Tax=Roridomyces roridus TaxID=1738132 RepID=A0AAD7FLL7_9AGAR|nr:hypothetical protein FB45DRAFT_73661 [Roridomyces roridus]
MASSLRLERSQEMSYPRLPPELIRSVIEDVSEANIKDLLACALVSRDWLAFARAIPDFCIWSEKEAMAFIELIQAPNATFPPALRCMTISKRDRPAPYIQLIPMLSSFSSLRSLTLANLDLTEVPLPPTLTKLVLNYCHFANHAAFIRSISRLADLQHLNLWSMTWATPPGTENQSTSHTTDVPSLTLYHDELQKSYQYSLWPLRPRKFILESEHYTVKQLPVLSRYLVSLGTHLQELHLRHTRRSIGQLDYTANSDLQHLVIHEALYVISKTLYASRSLQSLIAKIIPYFQLRTLTLHVKPGVQPSKSTVDPWTAASMTTLLSHAAGETGAIANRHVETFCAV